MDWFREILVSFWTDSAGDYPPPILSVLPILISASALAISLLTYRHTKRKNKLISILKYKQLNGDGIWIDVRNTSNREYATVAAGWTAKRIFFGWLKIPLWPRTSMVISERGSNQSRTEYPFNVQNERNHKFPIYIAQNSSQTLMCWSAYIMKQPNNVYADYK